MGETRTCDNRRAPVNNWDEAAFCELPTGHDGPHVQSSPWFERWPATPSVSPETPTYRPGAPCAHRGCLSHLSHPCDGCGRVGGFYPATPASAPLTCEHHVGSPMAADLCGKVRPCPKHDAAPTPSVSPAERAGEGGATTTATAFGVDQEGSTASTTDAGESTMGLTNSFACVDINGPRVGQRFVELEASEGAWDELTEEITRVVGPADGIGQWWVEWVIPAVANPPAVFTETYGAAFGQARVNRSIVEYRGGRWRRPLRVEDDE